MPKVEAIMFMADAEVCERTSKHFWDVPTLTAALAKFLKNCYTLNNLHARRRYGDGGNPTEGS